MPPPATAVEQPVRWRNADDGEAQGWAALVAAYMGMDPGSPAFDSRAYLELNLGRLYEPGCTCHTGIRKVCCPVCSD